MNWIDPDAIQANAAAQNWEEAVRLAGELLVQTGYVKPRYVEAMIATTKELGPYAVIAPGIAMPHARPEEGVVKSGFSAVSLTPPVAFGSAENDPVYLVIGFCATDHTGHIDSLARIAQRISTEGFLDEVIQAANQAELERILNGGDA